MNQTKKSIQELNLMDDFLLGEAMLHKETAVPVVKLIIERATGLKVKQLVVECQKAINGVDTDRHGIRMDVSISEVDIKEENAELVRLYDIEPNNKREIHLPRRSRYYQSLTDVKLLSTGTDYEKLPELWTIWILPYDPFGKNRMIYLVKNMVEGFEKINYNDGIRTLFLYTDGTYGGSTELKNLLKYMKNSRKENAVDSELATLHSKVERLKSNREIGVKYMHIQEKIEDMIREAQKQAIEEGLAKGLAKGLAEGLAKGQAKEREEGLAKGQAKGREEGLAKAREEAEKKLISIVCKKLQKEKSIAEIADELEEPEDLILTICEAAEGSAPVYDTESIYQSLHGKM